MITFEEIKDKANRISDALDSPYLLDIFDNEVVVQELAARDIDTIGELIKVYKQVKNGSLGRKEGGELQEKLKREWERDIC